MSLSGCITDIQQRNLPEQASYIYAFEAAVLAEIKAAPLCPCMVALKAHRKELAGGELPHARLPAPAQTSGGKQPNSCPGADLQP